MAKQLLQEMERETEEVPPAPQEGKYLRLVGGKVIYITEAEVREEEVLAKPTELTDRDVFVFEWNDRIKRAEQLKERISLIHQMMRDDEQRPSQYDSDYNALWGQYRDAITSLRELDSEPVDRFRDKVVARVMESKVRLNAVDGNRDPNDFDIYERMFACYEKNFDLMVALQ